ncbi:unnamed protein product [Ectocarpus sp. 12 AP-2014]
MKGVRSKVAMVVDKRSGGRRTRIGSTLCQPLVLGINNVVESLPGEECPRGAGSVERRDEGGRGVFGGFVQAAGDMRGVAASSRTSRPLLGCVRCPEVRCR